MKQELHSSNVLQTMQNKFSSAFMHGFSIGKKQTTNMKKGLLLLMVLIGSIGLLNATNYWWVGGTTTAALGAANTLSLSKGGTAVSAFTPATTDVITFDGSDISSTAGNQTGTMTFSQGAASYTIGQIIIINSATVVYNSTSSGRNLTIGGGIAGNDFTIDATSSFQQTGSSIAVAMATGNVAVISGTYTCGGGSNTHTFTSVDASGITFASGSHFVPGSSGGNFGSTTANSVVFQSGSNYDQGSTGANPFQLTAPSSVVVFNTGSNFNMLANVAPAMNGRTYGNFVVNFSTFSQSLTGATGCTVGDITITNGTLNMNLTGTMNITGNISVASGKTLTFTPASATNVNFNGTAAQTIANNGGTLTFAANANVVIANTASTVTFSTAQTISGSMTVNSSATLATSATLTLSGTPAINGAFQLNSGGFATGGTWAYGSSGTLIYNSSTQYGTGAHIYWPSTSGPVNVTLLGAGGAQMQTALGARTISGTLVLNAALDVQTAGNLTVTGTIQINSGGSISTNAPIYGASSTLTYNSTGTYGRGIEWNATGTGTIGTTAGYPNNVTIQNSTTLNYPNGSTTARSCNGTLTIGSGSALYMDYSSPSMNNPLTVKGSFSNSGSISLGDAAGGDLLVAGSFTNSGTFTHKNRTVTLNGASGTTQTVSGASLNGTGATNCFYNLTINNTSGGVTLAAPVGVTNVLTLTSGIVATDATNFMYVKNTATSGISGGSTTTFINGPLKWDLPASTSGTATYTFPIGGATTYYPMSVVNPVTGTGTITLTGTAFNSSAGGTNDGTTLNTPLSTTEYWSLAAAGNFTSSNISLTRQTAVGSFDAIGMSTTKTGTYASIAGTASGNSITGSNSTSGAAQFFVYATKIISTPPTITASGGVVASSPGSTTSGYVGNTITINGTFLNTVTVVKVGGSSGTPVTITGSTSTTLTFVAINQGGQIYIQNPAGNATSTETYTNLGYITTTTGDWNTTGTWFTGALPPANAMVTIAHDVTVNGTVTNAVNTVTVSSAKNLTFGASGTLTVNDSLTITGTVSMSAGGTLTIAASNTPFFTNNGTFATGGTVIFSNSTTINGSAATTFNNLTLTTGTLTLTTVPTINGTFTINGGSVSAAPKYGASSTLFYNVSYGRFNEWNATGIGTIGTTAGYPNNVTINTGTYDIYNSASGVARALAGVFTINNGATVNFNGMNAAFTVGKKMVINTGGIVNMNTTSVGASIGDSLTISGALNMNTMTAAITVNKDVNLNGTLALSSSSGGDINLGGNWSFTAGGTFTTNSRAVFFQGASQQTISRSASGTLNFDFIINNNTSGGLKLSSGTSLNINGSGNALQMNNAGGNTFDLNGNTLTMASGANISTTGTETITGTTASTLNASTCTVSGSGTLTFGANVTIALTGGFNFGSGLSTINGTLQINASGFVSLNAPTYGTGSILNYNNGASYGRGTEWSSTSGAGYPYHVSLTTSGTSLDMGNGGTGTARAMAGNLTIASGTTFTMDFSGHTMTAAVTVNGSVSNAGNLTLSSNVATGGDIKIGGNFTQNGTFTPNGRAIFFIASTGTQTISASSSPVTIPYIILGTTGGHTVQLANTSILATAVNGGNAIDFGNASNIFDLNGYNITIGTAGQTCNFAGSGYFKGHASSTMTIAGTTSTGTIQFSSTLQLSSLTINLSGGGVTLASALTVGTLAFTSGTITLGTNDLTATTITGASSSKYIVTNSTGALKQTVGSGAVAYPIGTASLYNPITLNNTGGTSDTYKVSVASGAPANVTTTTDYVQDTWIITEGTAGGSNLAITTQWNASTLNTQDEGSTFSQSLASNGLYVGGGWTIQTATVGGSNPYTAAASTFAPADMTGGIACITGVFPIVPPTSQANTITFTSIASTSMTINWSRGNGSKIAVFVKDASGTITNPTDNNTYTASSNWNTGAPSGTQLGTSGYYCVLNGTAASVGLTNLQLGHTYYVQAFEYNGTAGHESYYTATATGNPNSQLVSIVPTATTGSGSANTTTTITLNGTVNANGASTTTSFDYGTTTGYSLGPVTASPSPVTGTSGTSVSVGISSLTANTLYHFRVNGSNVSGTTNGSDATTTTVSNAPVMDNATGRSIAATSFTANWTAPSAQGSATYTYSIDISTDNTFATGVVNHSGISSGTLSYAYTGLSSATTYYYRVMAVNAGGNSAYSATSSSVTTLTIVVPTVTTTDAATSITLNGATSGGNVTSAGNGVISAVGLVYNTTGSPTLADGVTSIGSPGVGTFSSNLTGLSNNQIYYVKAYATNSAGTTYETTGINFTTLTAEPTTASTVTFANVTDVQMDINFSGGNGGRRMVFVRSGSAVNYTPTDGTSPSGINSVFGSGTAFNTSNYAVYDGTGSSVTITGLSKNTTYHVAVYEYSNNSVGSPNYYATGGLNNQITMNPSFTTSAPSLTSFGNVISGASSSSSSFTVSGSQLVSNVTVTAPTGFTVSTDNSSFFSSVNLVPSSGTLSSVSVFVKFSPSSANGSNIGNVALTATNATSQNVTVAGHAISTEPTTEGSITFGTATTTTIPVNLTSIGNGGYQLIVVKAGSAPTAPSDSVAYTANASLASAGTTAAGSFVVYNNNSGTGSPIVTVTGLTAGTTYYFAVYEYNVGTGTSQNYIATSTVTGSIATTSVSAATDFFRSKTTGNWGSTSSWESSTNGTTLWHDATLVPDSTASGITVLNTHTITLAANATGKLVNVNTGGQITTNYKDTLFVGSDGSGTHDIIVNGYFLNKGALTLKGGLASLSTANVLGTYEAADTSTWSTTVTIPTATWSSGSTCKLTGLVGVSGADFITLQGIKQSFYNFVIDLPNLVGKLVLCQNGTNTVGNKFAALGDFTVNSTGSGTGMQFLKSGTQDTVNIGGNFNINAGNVFGVQNTSSNNTRKINVTGNVNVNGGTLNLLNSTGGTTSNNITLNVTGNLTIASGATLTRTNTSGTSVATIDFVGATQSFTNSGTVGTFSGTINLITTGGTGTLTLNSDFAANTVTADGSNLTVSSGKTLSIATAGTIGSSKTLQIDGIVSSAVTITNSGTMTVSNGGKFQHNMNGGTIPTATWNTGSTCELTGITATAPTAGLSQNFHHFTWNNAGQTTTVNITGALTTVNGNLTVMNIGTPTSNAGFRLTNATSTLNIGGDLIISAANGVTSRLDLNGSAGTSTINVSGNVTLSVVGTGVAQIMKKAATGVINFVKSSGSQTFSCNYAHGIDSSTINWNVGDGTTTTNTVTLGSNFPMSTSSTLTILSGASVDCGTNVISSGSTVTVNSGGTLKVGSTSGSGALATNVTTSSILLNTGSTVEYNGLSAQFAALRTFDNVKINNSYGVTLVGDITINGTLTFTSGKITTSTNNVILSSTGSISGATAGKYVYGNLKRFIPSSATTATFDIGDASVYAPVTTGFTGTISVSTGSITASTTSGDHSQIATSGIDATTSINRTWTLTNNTALTGLTSYSPTFTFVSGDIDGGTTTGTFVVREYTGSAWNTTTSGSMNSLSSQATGVTTYGDFAIGNTTGTPSITTNPSNNTVCSGSTNVTFTAASTSIPTASITWKRGISGVYTTVDGSIDGGVYSGFNSGTLTISSVSNTLNGYTYEAFATNINGTSSASTAATLTVNARPTAAAISGTATICNGSSTNLSVAITGGTSPFTVVYTGGAGGTVSSYTTGSSISVSPSSTTTYGLTSVTDANGCTVASPSGAPVVTVNAIPTLYNVTAAGSSTSAPYCSGTGGVALTLSNSTSGVNYQLVLNGTSSGSGDLIAGNGSALSFGNKTTAGTYRIAATNATTGCYDTMNNAPVVSILTLPTASINYTGAPFCTSDGTGSVTISSITGGPLTSPSFTSTSGITLNGTSGDITPSLSTVGSYTVKYRFTGTNGCTDSTTTSVSFNQSGLWKVAATDGSFSTGSNWSCGTAPLSTDNVVLPASSNHYPTVSSSTSIAGLSIASGASITVTDNLHIAGNLSNSGTLTASAGTITLNGSSAQTVAGSFTVKNLVINNTSGGVALGSTSADSVYVTGVYTPTSGTLSTNGRLVLVSDASGTASVAAGSGSYISGDVTVQRYHSNKRAWLMITAPLTTNGSSKSGNFRSNWQQNTYITGTKVNTLYGLDTGFNTAYSIIYWTGSAWGKGINSNTALTTDSANTLFGGTGGTTADNKAFFMYIRGNRSIVPLNVTGSTAVTLRASGSLQTGDKNFALSSGSYSLVANPYAAPIDLDQFRQDNSGLATSGNVTFYYWDPNLSGTGGYVTAQYLAGSWNFSSQNGANTTPRFIQSGQAFFVITNGQTSVAFHESQKTTDSSSNGVFGGSTSGKLKIELNKGGNMIDGVLSLYNNSFNAAVSTPTEDALKLWGNEENIGILRNANYLSIEARPEIGNADTTYLYMNKMVAGTTYNFGITATDLPVATKGYLVDKFTNTRTALNMNTVNNITFNVDTNAASKSPNRFMIVFSNSAPLSVSGLQIKASVKAKTAVIDWKVVNEKDVDHYEVERSREGVSFVKIVNNASNNAANSSYTYTDNQAVNGANYYRIKAISKDGTIQYSSVAKVTIGDKTEGISVYPNPVTGKNVNIVMSNINAGKYTVSMYNANGQQIMEQGVQHAGGSVTTTLTLPSNVSAGIYQLKLTGSDKTYTETVIVK